MRVLLTDGTSLTSRQVARLLWRSGHEVGVLSPDPLCLARFTRGVRRLHRVPPYGPDPIRWLAATRRAYAAGGYDVLFPTQEQVAVLSMSAAALLEDGVATAVPSFEALLAVQDKLAAHATLAKLGIPQPEATVLTSGEELAAWSNLPVFVKAPIGTATSGVWRVDGRNVLRRLARELEASGAFADGGVLAQSVVDGPLVMLQGVFSEGGLVALHANLRVRAGARGGASHKRSIDLPEARALLATLGRELRWNGALSADAISTPQGPAFIDINPRLVEPGNAWASGVDLAGAMLDIARQAPGNLQPVGRSGVRTHQLLLAVLGAAQEGRGRSGVLRELSEALRHDGAYEDSAEELTPVSGDWRAAVPLLLTCTATLVRPATWRWFSESSVANYALTPEGWRVIRSSGQSAATPRRLAEGGEASHERPAPPFQDAVPARPL